MKIMNTFIFSISLITTVACSNSADSNKQIDPGMDNNATNQVAEVADDDAVLEAGLNSSWDQMLKTHVKGDLVDYKGFVMDKDKLHAYCEKLSVTPPAENAGQNEKLAYYINVYNAQTVKLIIDNYPVSSIKDLHPTIKIPGVNSVWHVTKFMVGDEEMSLNDVEHNVLRKMNEPRIHFAVNCASMSCPPLRNEAYTAEMIDAQLTEQAKAFINTKKFNEVSSSDLKLSAIFNWFEGDFKKDGSVIPFLNKYSTVKIDPNAKVNYLDYDWRLNDTK